METLTTAEQKVLDAARAYGVVWTYILDNVECNDQQSFDAACERLDLAEHHLRSAAFGLGLEEEKNAQ